MPIGRRRAATFTYKHYARLPPAERPRPLSSVVAILSHDACRQTFEDMRYVLALLVGLRSVTHGTPTTPSSRYAHAMPPDRVGVAESRHAELASDRHADDNIIFIYRQACHVRRATFVTNDALRFVVITPK